MIVDDRSQREVRSVANQAQDIGFTDMFEVG